MNLPRIQQVRSSAGSGKTYSLTERFLELLNTAKIEEPRIECRSIRPELYSWPEILAVTFTNKAASAMKDRILMTLKRYALGLIDEQHTSWDPRRAAKVLEAILRCYHRLNIRTIDSLLVLLLRNLAVDYGLQPNFVVALEENTLFNPAYERFVQNCIDPNGPQRTLLVKALTTFLGFEGCMGFKLERSIRDRLFELTSHLIQTNSLVLLENQESISQLLDNCRGEFLKVVNLLHSFLTEYNLTPYQHFSKFLDKCQKMTGFEEPPDSAYANKLCLTDCLIKASQANVTKACKRAYDVFKIAFANYRREWAGLEGAYALNPALDIARELLLEIHKEARRQGVMPMSLLNTAVQNLLARDEPLPEAYCFLGSRLHHLLIDEFQDTSQAQWSALEPLARECLSKGGSLFYVGDVKQAIYGWRGGDSSLFDQIPNQLDIAGVTNGTNFKNLPYNWRSAPAIVDWNNTFCTLLATLDNAKKIVDICLENATHDERTALAQNIATTFVDACQKLPKKYSGPEGYVHINQLPSNGNAEEIKNTSLKILEATIQNLGQRRPWHNLAVLVRDNQQARFVCERLVTLNIPVVTEKSLLLARHPVVRQIAALLAFLDCPTDDLSFLTFIMGSLFQEATELTQEAIMEWLMDQKTGNLGFKFREVFALVWTDWFQPFFDKVGLLTPYDFTQAAIQRLQILERNPDAELHVNRFLEVIHLAEGKGYCSLSTFLNYWQNQGAEEQVPMPDHLDAVRVLTIHKAKGLEFPIVLAPFHNWPVQPQKGFALLDIQDRHVLTPMRAALGPAYRRLVGREICEQLHLLYVTWTRACEELYIFYPAKKGGKKRPPALVAIDLLLESNKNITERGRQDLDMPQQFALSKTLQPIKPITTSKEFTVWLPRLRIFRHILKDVFENKCYRGKIIHKALELLYPTGDDASDALRATRLAFLDFPVTASDDYVTEIVRLLKWVLAHPKLKHCIGQGLAKAEALDADGQNICFDRIVLQEDEALVLEYKTGIPELKHITQIKRYLNLAAGLRPKIRGMLVYLDMRKVLEIKHG